MRAAWLTDIHLDFLSPRACQDFFARVASTIPDAVFLTGDVSIAPALLDHLSALSEAISKPVYFVLGNHDFYHGSITEMRVRVRHFCRTHPWLNYLTSKKIVPLTQATALVGHDGWGDGRYGDYPNSTVRLNDHLLIRELTGLTSARLQQRLMRLGNAAATSLRKVLPDALSRYQQVILLTHVPPFRESCWYQGRVSNDDWLPFFACQAVGDVLREEMAKRPDRQMTVYCGHTHNAGTVQILPNLRVVTGAAEYGAPQISDVLTII